MQYSNSSMYESLYSLELVERNFLMKNIRNIKVLHVR
jgi:hypothetical protein